MADDVAIVGAGPTGLALACGLHAAGLSVRVLDAAEGPAVTSRALGLQPRGVEVLDRLGALGDLPRQGLPIARVEVAVEGRPMASLNVGQQTSLGGPRALLMSQAVIEGALRHRLAELGGAVEWGRPVSELAVRPDEVTLRLGNGPEVTAGWVVGADGAHSVVREAAGIGFPGVPIVERFMLADVHADVDRPRDGAHTWMRGKVMLAAFPLPGSDLWRLMSPASGDATHALGPDEIVELLGARLATETGGTIRAAEWTSTFRIQRRIADAYRRGRLFLAGDAAHIHSPFGGQGMNTGLGDAENLAWKLAAVVGGHADERLLDTYEAERRPIAKDVLSTTSGLTELVLGEGRAARLLRDRVAVPLLNQRWMQRLITDKSSQLQISYRRGPLGTRRLFPVHRPRPGDRVPDGTYVGADGTATRLYEVLGWRWALIGPAEFDEATARLGGVALLRATGESMLVRPDGHLAWRGSDANDLRAWLDRTLGSRATVRAR